MGVSHTGDVSQEVLAFRLDCFLDDMLACVQVIRVDGVQAAKASLLEIRLESRWFHSKLLSKPSLVFGFPKAWLYPR